MAMTQNEIDTLGLDLELGDYIAQLSESYLRAITRNEFGGEVNYHVDSMTLAELVTSVQDHSFFEFDRIWFNTTRTHGCSRSQLTNWIEDRNWM